MERWRRIGETCKTRCDSHEKKHGADGKKTCVINRLFSLKIQKKGFSEFVEKYILVFKEVSFFAVFSQPQK